MEESRFLEAPFDRMLRMRSASLKTFENLLSVYIWFYWELSRTKWDYHQNYLLFFYNNQEHVWNKTYFTLIKYFLMLPFTSTYLTTTCIFNSWYFNFYQIRHVSVYRFSWAELQYVADQAESCRSFSVGRPTRNLKQKFKPFLCWNPHWKWLSSKSF